MGWVTRLNTDFRCVAMLLCGTLISDEGGLKKNCACACPCDMIKECWQRSVRASISPVHTSVVQVRKWMRWTSSRCPSGCCVFTRAWMSLLITQPLWLIFGLCRWFHWAVAAWPAPAPTPSSFQLLHHRKNEVVVCGYYASFLYIGWNDVIESMVMIQSPFCGYNLV